jgi:pSer/pThr/pTyr-binding forkhead associated (FHA) protein
MSRPAPPALTVRYDGSTRTFAPGNDVVVGRDARADVRVAHALVSREHLVLRFDHGRWVAIDDGSLNGMYVDGRQVSAVDIQDGMQIKLADPQGPVLTFEVGRQHCSAGTPSPGTSVRATGGASPSRSSEAPTEILPQVHPPTTSHPQPAYPSGPQPGYPSGSQSNYPRASAYQSNPSKPIHSAPESQPISSPAFEWATSMAPAAAPHPSKDNLATSNLKMLQPGRTTQRPPGSIKIGRAPDNDIVVSDVLASRHHATLVPVPGGTEIRDARSSNGTFVNGARVESAPLHDGDVVTIGNADLVFSGRTLVRRNETAAATHTGGLEVHGVTLTIEAAAEGRGHRSHSKTLLDYISLTARPGTLTAVIGPSGAGKSTFARLVAGYTHPTTGTVTFEGHNIHAEYASLRSRIGMVPQDDVVHP